MVYLFLEAAPKKCHVVICIFLCFIRLKLILLTHSLSLFYDRVKISDDYLIDNNLHLISIEDAHFRNPLHNHLNVIILFFVF